MVGYQSNSMNDVYNEIDGYDEDNDDVLVEHIFFLVRYTYIDEY